MKITAPAFIKVIAESSPADLQRFATERSIQLEWTVDESFLALAARYGLERRGATAWSTSGEDWNQRNLKAFVSEAVNLYGPSIIQSGSFDGMENKSDSDLRDGISRVINGNQQYQAFPSCIWPEKDTRQWRKLVKSLARITVARTQAGIFIRLTTGFDNDRHEFDALTYPSMQNRTRKMRRPTFLTPLEADEVLRSWQRGDRAHVEIDDEVRAAFDKLTASIVVGYKAGAPAMAMIRAGHKLKDAPVPAKDQAITLKKIAIMREQNPNISFYVHPSLNDIVSMNAAHPHPDERLRPYQQEAVGLHLATKIGYLQACDTGAGKTVMQLAAMCERSKMIDNYRGLIVCEATLREQWQEEAERWFPEAQLVFVKAGKDAGKVADLLAMEGPAVVVTSYAHVVSALSEAERRAAVMAGEDADPAFDPDALSLGAMLLDTRWHDAAADEAVCIRNNSSKQCKALWELRDSIDVATALTATPRNKSHDDIGHLLAWVRNDRFMFAGDTKLSLCYDEDNPVHAKRLFDTLGPLMFRRDSSEFADDLPDVNPIVERLQPTPAESMLAHAAENELKRIYFELVEALEHAERTKAADPEALAEAKAALREAHSAWLGGTTLARMTMSDPVSILDSNSVGAKLLIAQGLVQAAIDSNPTKRARLLADVSERVGKGQQVLVFTEYSTVANLLVQHLTDHGISAAPFTGKNLSSRDRNRVAFQAGEIDVLVVTSAGTRGLTLTAATAVIHYDLPWTIERVIQRTGRIVRFGSAHACVDIVFYILEGTIDERMVDHLVANGRAATLVLDTSRGVNAGGSGTARALGGLIASAEGAKKAKRIKQNANGAVELGKVLLAV